MADNLSERKVLNLNPFKSYYHRFAFDVLMFAAGLSIVYICVMTGVIK